ncbi:MAG: hypothetical protein AAB293_01985, partial [Pseudomonadota bacterium]
TVVDHNIAYSNRTRGFTSNSGDNVKFTHNTSWNNGLYAFVLDSHTIAINNIGVGTIYKSSTATNIIEENNSWQHAGCVAFISTDSDSVDFLKPVSGGSFEDVGAI